MAWFTMRVVGLTVFCALGCTYDYGALEGKDGGAEIPITGTGGGGAGATGGRATATGGAGTTTGGSKGASGGAPGSGGTATGGATVDGSGGMATGGTQGGGSGTAGATQAGGTGALGGAVGLGGAGGTARAGGAGGAMNNGGANADTDLMLRYAFDEKSGTTVNDTSGSAGGPHNGALATVGSGGSATFASNKVVGAGALALKGNGNSAGGYVTTPAPVTLAPQAITLAAWVNITTVGTHQRVFDFGSGTTKYFLLTPSEAVNRIRFAITANGLSGEQSIAATGTLTPQTWHHIAVVLPAGATYTGTMYIDGTAVATNTAMTLHPTDVGMTTGNYLGRSAYSADPYFNGLLDDFRIYRRALSAAEIVALAAIRD